MTFERNVKGLLGTKLGMTQLWDENNKVVPVTVIVANTNVVTQIRTPETDGYNAVQVGFGEIEGRKVNKPQAGQFAKAGTTPRRHLVEIRTADASSYTVGQELPAGCSGGLAGVRHILITESLLPLRAPRGPGCRSVVSHVRAARGVRFAPDEPVGGCRNNRRVEILVKASVAWRKPKSATRPTSGVEGLRWR